MILAHPSGLPPKIGSAHCLLSSGFLSPWFFLLHPLYDYLLRQILMDFMWLIMKHAPFRGWNASHAACVAVYLVSGAACSVSYPVLSCARCRLLFAIIQVKRGGELPWLHFQLNETWHTYLMHHLQHGKIEISSEKHPVHYCPDVVVGVRSTDRNDELYQDHKKNVSKAKGGFL